MTKVTTITLTALVLLLASAITVSAVDMVEIRGPVATVEDGAIYTWGPQQFAGFYYDIDDDIGQESITLTITGDILDEPDGIVYETVAQPDDFDFAEWGEFMTIGFFAENYFAAYVENEDDPMAAYLADDSTDTNLMADEQLSKVLYDDDEERTFTSGTPLELKEGYELAIQSIDLDGNKVYVQLMKDGSVVDSAVVEPSKDGADIADKTYTYTADLGDTEDIVIIAVHFKNAFRGSDQDLATVDGIWQISDTYTDVEEDTEYDKMTIQTVNSEAYSIMMNNEDNKITLSNDKDQLLMENIRIKTADQDVITAEEPLRFYIYEEATIEEAGAAAEQPEPQVKEAPVEEAAVEEAPVEEAPAEEAPVEEAAVEEAPAEEAPAEENMTEEAPAEEEAGGIPGFEAVFAITGLLAVSYLVLRRRE